jgi:hypothetical protein
MKHFFVLGGGEARSSLDILAKFKGLRLKTQTIEIVEATDAELQAYDFDIFHVLVEETTGLSLSHAELSRLTRLLPAQVQRDLIEWGFTDTLMREKVYQFLKSTIENGGMDGIKAAVRTGKPQ